AGKRDDVREKRLTRLGEERHDLAKHRLVSHAHSNQLFVREVAAVPQADEANLRVDRAAGGEIEVGGVRGGGRWAAFGQHRRYATQVVVAEVHERNACFGGKLGTEHLELRVGRATLADLGIEPLEVDAFSHEAVQVRRHLHAADFQADGERLQRLDL